MKKRKTAADHAKAATRAHTDLNIFYGVIALMEGGLLSADSYAAAERIVAMCKRQGQACLTRYDRALSAVASTERATP